MIERLVADAGFRELAVERHTRDYAVADPEEEWRRRLEEPSGAASRVLSTLPPDEQRRLHDEVIAALETYRRDDEIRLPSEAILVTGVR